MDKISNLIKLLSCIDKIETPNGSPCIDYLSKIVSIKRDNQRELIVMNSSEARLAIDNKHPDYKKIKIHYYENDRDENRSQGYVIIHRITDNKYFEHSFDECADGDIFYYGSTKQVNFYQVYPEISIKLNYE